MNEYELTRSIRLIQDFVIDDLSNWYVRLNRKRFWKPGLEQATGRDKDKVSAYQTLLECLEKTSIAASIFAPFFFAKPPQSKNTMFSLFSDNC